METKLQSLTLSTLALLSLFSLTIIPTSQSAHHHHTAAPAPSVDCTTMVLNMADCLSFVTNGSTITKPERGCCSGFKMVLTNGPQCLCEAFMNSAQLGVVVNVTKAMTLTSTCGFRAPSFDNCGRGALAPTSGSAVQAPTPTPGSSDSYGLSVSVGSLVFGFITVLLGSSPVSEFLCFNF